MAAGQLLVLQAAPEVGALGSIVMLLCDGGERYRNTYKPDAWLAVQGLDLAPHNEVLPVAPATGSWPE